jgi:hypothetical protein
VTVGTAYEMAVRTAIRAARARRRLQWCEPDEPWWCSLTCVCENCLDVDTLIIENRRDSSGRQLFADAS